jgi:hypothetical protein
MEQAVGSTEQHGSNQPSGKFYTFFVDDREFHVDQTPITARVIMEKAGVPIEQGLFIIQDDDTQRQVDPDEEFDLQPGRRFKKAPRFRRG